jgi:hypothetical protein
MGAFFKSQDFLTGYAKFDFRYDAAERARYEDLRALTEMLPRDASVAVMERVGAHAANRVRAYSMRNGPQGAEYILGGKNDGVEGERAHLGRMLANGEYGVWQRRGEFVILKRGFDTSKNEELRRDWRL